MNWIDESLADFGRSMGLESLAFSDQGVVSLVFEAWGELYLERLHNGLLVYLCRGLDRPDAGLYARALELCHWRHNYPFPVNPAVHEDKVLVFSVQLSEQDGVTGPALDEVVRLLTRLHDQTHEVVAP
jgi:type III secretion system chaperone SycN